jgi:hypothetical protein
MGIMIAYQGQLSDPGRVDEMVRDIQAFADHMKWRTWTVADLVAQGHIRDTGLRGITVSVHSKSQALHFHIDSQGRFVNHSYHAAIHNAEDRRLFIEAMLNSRNYIPASTETPEPDLDEFFDKGVTYNWTKTQFGGPAAHVQACTLIRFVRDRFAPELYVKDDTGYFEHGRLEELTAKMGQVEQVIHLVQRAAERIQDEGGVSDLKGLLEKLQHYMDEERTMLH